MRPIIGITMRVTEYGQYHEPVDAIANNWYTFITKIYPSAILIPILNKTQAIDNLLKTLSMNCVIFANGNDIGAAPERDATEKLLFENCLEMQIPMFGVCRGLQMLNMLFGGGAAKNLRDTSSESHINTKHTVKITDTKFAKLAGSQLINVNSYHSQGILLDDLAPPLQHFALTDHLVEGLYHPTMPIIAVQWHPERNQSLDNFTSSLLKSLIE